MVHLVSVANSTLINNSIQNAMKIAVLIKTALDTGQLRVRDTVVVEETPSRSVT